MGKYIVIIALFIAIFSPSVVEAKGLTEPQIQAIISLLQAFNVEYNTIALVESNLRDTPKTPEIKAETAVSTPEIEVKTAIIKGYDAAEPVLYNAPKATYTHGY